MEWKQDEFSEAGKTFVNASRTFVKQFSPGQRQLSVHQSRGMSRGPVDALMSTTLSSDLVIELSLLS